MSMWTRAVSPSKTYFCTKGTNFNECGNGFTQFLRAGKKQMSPEYAEVIFTRPVYMFGTSPGNRGIATWREYLDLKRKGLLKAWASAAVFPSFLCHKLKAEPLFHAHAISRIIVPKNRIKSCIVDTKC